MNLIRLAIGAVFMVGVGLQAAAEAPRAEDLSFKAASDGTEQRYVLIYPEGFDATAPRDMLIALHGHGSDRNQFASSAIAEARGARDVAAKHGMLFVLPDYRATTSWMGPAAEADMVQLIGELKKRFPIERTFVCGASMGGASSLTFAALHPELVDGVASMNGLANHFDYERFQAEISASFGGGKAEVPEEYKRRSAEYWPERLTMPVAIAVGGKDDGVPPDSVLRLGSVLQRLQGNVLVINRPETGHTTSYEDAVAIIEYVVEKAAKKQAGGAPEVKDARQTIYVSPLGDGSDGSSWAKAFTTIQAALEAVPDGGGGHRVVVRPGTYMEANLLPAQRGAAGAYNELVGDFDGSLGSGASGWVVIDSGDPARGFKSYDWHTTIRAYKPGWSAEHTGAPASSANWDRWKLSRLYATGSDAGLFFDLVDDVQPFSVVVEDCVGIGRAFGGGVANVLSRPEEPIAFRRCHLWALDFWGDTSGAYVRVENKSMPATADAVFEDCTLVGPQCALKSSNFGFQTYSRIRLKNCKLAALNFSQPQGTPTDGVIQSVQNGKLLHVDLEDCMLMGYKVFGVIVDKESADDIGFTTKGKVAAYVQFQQETPPRFERLTRWPTEMFERLAPPAGP